MGLPLTIFVIEPYFIMRAPASLKAFPEGDMPTFAYET